MKRYVWISEHPIRILIFQLILLGTVCYFNIYKISYLIYLILYFGSFGSGRINSWSQPSLTCRNVIVSPKTLSCDRRVDGKSDVQKLCSVASNCNSKSRPITTESFYSTAKAVGQLNKVTAARKHWKDYVLPINFVCFLLCFKRARQNGHHYFTKPIKTKGGWSLSSVRNLSKSCGQWKARENMNLLPSVVKLVIFINGGKICTRCQARENL